MRRPLVTADSTADSTADTPADAPAVAVPGATEASRAERPRRRRWMSVVAWLVVLPFAVWAALRLVPGDVHFRWVQLVAFTPYVALASPAPVLVALVSRRWAALAASLAVAAVFAACVLPRVLPDGDSGADEPPGANGAGGTGRTALRVVASNLRYGGASPAAVIDLVRTFHADVLTLQELTPQAVTKLEEAGLTRLLPYKVDRSRPGAAGSGIYARFPVTPEQAIDLGRFGQARAIVDVPGAGPVDVVSVHPCAPRIPERQRCWADGLAALPPPGGAVRILAGDFNATLDHARVRRLLGLGYRDAADATGAGLSTTWPYMPWSIDGHGIPPVTLDHVLVGPGVTVRSFGVRQVPATDHKAVYAELALPRVR
ncbi:endonuclease/exonuclease/phosphatase family protein [Planotetraspora sp. GP83]|uniref:endonuclease/exonuclease/phosphatase family protein n=1 Tax=Planotetraspora sp. GP83 TaxID=3156264 RepID=UPI003517E4A2